MEVGKVIKRGEYLFFFFFCFSLLKTTEICFGSTKMEISYREKKHFTPGKKAGKWLCPIRKICLLRPCAGLFECTLQWLHIWLKVLLQIIYAPGPLWSIYFRLRSIYQNCWYIDLSTELISDFRPILENLGLPRFSSRSREVIWWCAPYMIDPTASRCDVNTVKSWSIFEHESCFYHDSVCDHCIRGKFYNILW